MNTPPFTFDDLTGDEYATVAHKVRADPLRAILDPASTRRAEAQAGLLWARELRTNPAARFTDFMAMSTRDVNIALGIYPDPSDLVENRATDDDVEEDEDGPARTVVDAAQEAVDDLTGEAYAVDPSRPTASPSSP